MSSVLIVMWVLIVIVFWFAVKWACEQSYRNGYDAAMKEKRDGG